MNYVRFGLWAAFVLALLYAGWIANGWRLQAAQASDLKAALRTEINRAIQADAARLAVEIQLDLARRELAKKVTTVKKTVTRYVAQNPDCDLPEPVAGQLQRLRQGHDVPAAPVNSTGAGTTAGN
jgi:hypothetical protein